jgi:flavin reductase (DIM6/NTAB) family NADH-FMN oxidoreductase RutF
MLFDPTHHHPRDVYRHLIAAITPRPIAWVSTVNGDGQPNLAPFSFFNGVCPNPPTVLFCPTNTREGRRKDTVRNVEATREFVINVVPHRLARLMNATSEEFPPDVNEFAACGLATVPSVRVKPPRVKESPVQMECVLHDIVHIGAPDGPLAGNIVIGRVVLMHIADDVLDSNGQIDPAKLDTIGRMGGNFYSTTRDRFEMPRPEAKSRVDAKPPELAQ